MMRVRVWHRLRITFMKWNQIEGYAFCMFQLSGDPCPQGAAYVPSAFMFPACLLEDVEAATNAVDMLFNFRNNTPEAIINKVDMLKLLEHLDNLNTKKPLRHFSTNITPPFQWVIPAQTRSVNQGKVQSIFAFSPYSTYAFSLNSITVAKKKRNRKTTKSAGDA